MDAFLRGLFAPLIAIRQGNLTCEIQLAWCARGYGAMRSGELTGWLHSLCAVLMLIRTTALAGEFLLAKGRSQQTKKAGLCGSISRLFRELHNGVSSGPLPNLAGSRM